MKIAFTSCIRYEAFKKQPEWDYIAAQNPDYLFLLGDIIYMDYGIKPFSKEPVGCAQKYTDTKFEKVMRKKYENQFNVSSFKTLVQTLRDKNGFYGIWDDHDFAWNNAKGANISQTKKDITRQLFHEFMHCSTNLPHVHYHIDTPLARVIFIDNRIDAEEGGKEKKLLSDNQFRFIEDKLNHSLPYTILCSGLTLTEGSESWKKYPQQMKKLCELIKEQKNILFLAGDIHYNAFIAPQYIKKIDTTTPSQFISSGMQINFAGLGLPIDDRHNWALLELYEKEASITYYKNDKVQKQLSDKASNWMKTNFTF